MKPILLCTLGGSWAVVPEIYGFLAPGVLDLYRDHPRASAFGRLREQLALAPPGEVWVATTGGKATEAALARLAEWVAKLDPPARFRAWVAAGTDALASSEECGRLRELLFRLCLHASESAGPENLILSLAGGRKTMSADLQRAGSLFGCRAMFHVVDTGRLPEELRDPPPELLCRALTPELASAIEPVFLGRGNRPDFVDLGESGYDPLRAEDFPLGDGSGDAELATARSGRGSPLHVVSWRAHGPSLADEIERREQSAVRFTGARIESLLREEKQMNWFGLYALPARAIERLRSVRVDESHLEALRSLPKADLHLHLGGALDVPAQREVARAIWDSLWERERQTARESVAELVASRDWSPELLGRVRRGKPDASACASAVLLALPPEEIERRLYAPTEPRIALKHRHPLGFRAYELPGELSGSVLLQREAGVEEYARQLVKRLARDGVRYAEVRASPDKYLGGEGLRFLQAFEGALREALRELREARTRRAEEAGAPTARVPEVRFLVVVDRRHGDERMRRAVDLAVKASRELHGFVAGLDLAGDEADRSGLDFDRLERLFAPAFEECLPLTIHAGEGEPPDRIWSAAYRLHAQRIGHGLTLADAPTLAQRLRDRNVAVELCPTSNIEVVGFRDPSVPETYEFSEYPLSFYLRHVGLSVVVSTDNPGIGRTDLAGELVRASRLSGGLSVWQALAVVRAGFAHAFLSSDERARILQEVDRLVFEWAAAFCEGKVSGA